MRSGRSMMVFRPISGARRRAFFSESAGFLDRDYGVQINFYAIRSGPERGANFGVTLSAAFRRSRLPLVTNR